MSRPERRLSPLRVGLLAVILIGLGVGGYFGFQQLRTANADAFRQTWFASYVDVTASPTFAFQQLGATDHRDAVLSFIVASPTDTCSPMWGASFSLDQAKALLSLDARIARLQQQGGNIAVSFGGRDNQELAIGCTDPDKLLSAYQSVTDRYSVNTIDLDLEGPGLTNVEASARRATAIATLQKNRRAHGKNLAVWATLPVAPTGLTEDDTNAISQLLAKGVDLAGVNVMTMNYGNSLKDNQTMLDGAVSALTETHRQLTILYDQAGIHLNSSTVWSKIGATPMIGQNNTENEIFTLDDATGLNKLVTDQKMGRVSMWSANRDIACGSNYVSLKVVSNSCSGVPQSPNAYAETLGSNLTGSITLSAGLVTTQDPTNAAATAPDDPAASPYQIWLKTGAYLQGTKVVWHHNVYQAKWWTQGDTPDNPVLQSWQTPWELIGPVLPGDKPIPQPTLPGGTYPDWSGTATYNTDDRVLFSGVPYQAKWWNKGESPAAASSNPTSSPWVPLTQAQINDIQAGLKK